MRTAAPVRFLNPVRAEYAAVWTNRRDTTVRHLSKLPREADYVVVLQPMTLCVQEGSVQAQHLALASVLPWQDKQHKEPSETI